MERGRGQGPEQVYRWVPLRRALNFLGRFLGGRRNIKEIIAVTGAERLFIISQVPHILVGTVTAEILASPMRPRDYREWPCWQEQGESQW